MTKQYAHDSRWIGDARAAIGTATLFPLLLMAVDTAADSTTDRRTLLWVALGVTLVAVLWPTRITAAPGLLTSRGLVQRHRVHTDRLVSVSWHDGVAQRLILRDTDGNRLELDPRVLLSNPPLWRLLETDDRTSIARGTLISGRIPLQQLSLRIDEEVARTVFTIPDLH